MSLNRIPGVVMDNDDVQSHGTAQYSTVYMAYVDGVRLGEVRKIRHSAGSEFRKGNGSGWGKGSWGWEADGAPEIDYPTRSNAVADAIRNRQKAGETA